MPAAKYDMVITKGVEFTRLVIWKDFNKVCIDLTPYTIEMEIRSTDLANVLATSIGSSPTILISVV
jgi:hypothetical protein